MKRRDMRRDMKRRDGKSVEPFWIRLRSREFQVADRVAFSYVIQPVAEGFTSWFSPPGMRRIVTRPAERSIALTYFPWNARSVIVAAGRSQTLMEFTYDGFRRLVEPYKIEYHVRKSDGIGSEHFWGYDKTGGKSGRIGIKPQSPLFPEPRDFRRGPAGFSVRSHAVAEQARSCRPRNSLFRT
jgi:hypothetical protein